MTQSGVQPSARRVTFCPGPLVLTTNRRATNRRAVGALIPSRRPRTSVCALENSGKNSSSESELPGSSDAYDEFTRLLGGDGKEVQRRIELDQAPKPKPVDKSAYSTFDAMLGGGGRKRSGSRRFATFDDVREAARGTSPAEGSGVVGQGKDVDDLRQNQGRMDDLRARKRSTNRMSEAEIADAYAFMDNAFSPQKNDEAEDEMFRPLGTPQPPSQTVKPPLLQKPMSGGNTAQEKRPPPSPKRASTVSSDLKSISSKASEEVKPPLLEKPRSSRFEPARDSAPNPVEGRKGVPEGNTNPLSEEEVSAGYEEMDNFLNESTDSLVDSSLNLSSSSPAPDSRPQLAKKPRHIDDVSSWRADWSDVSSPTRQKTADLGKSLEPSVLPPDLLEKPARETVTEGDSVTEGHQSDDATTKEAGSISVSDVAREIIPVPVLLGKPEAPPANLDDKGSTLGGQRGKYSGPVLILSNPKLLTRRPRAVLSLSAIDDMTVSPRELPTEASDGGRTEEAHGG